MNRIYCLPRILIHKSRFLLGFTVILLSSFFVETEAVVLPLMLKEPNDAEAARALYFSSNGERKLVEDLILTEGSPRAKDLQRVRQWLPAHTHPYFSMNTDELLAAHRRLSGGTIESLKYWRSRQENIDTLEKFSKTLLGQLPRVGFVADLIPDPEKSFAVISEKVLTQGFRDISPSQYRLLNNNERLLFALLQNSDLKSNQQENHEKQMAKIKELLEAYKNGDAESGDLVFQIAVNYITATLNGANEETRTTDQSGFEERLEEALTHQDFFINGALFLSDVAHATKALEAVATLHGDPRFIAKASQVRQVAEQSSSFLGAMANFSQRQSFSAVIDIVSFGAGTISAIINLFGSIGPSFEELVMKQLQSISHQIYNLSVQMMEQFGLVHEKLDRIHDDIRALKENVGILQTILEQIGIAQDERFDEINQRLNRIDRWIRVGCELAEIDAFIDRCRHDPVGSGTSDLILKNLEKLSALYGIPYLRSVRATNGEDISISLVDPVLFESETKGASKRIPVSKLYAVFETNTDPSSLHNLLNFETFFEVPALNPYSTDGTSRLALVDSGSLGFVNRAYALLALDPKLAKKKFKNVSASSTTIKDHYLKTFYDYGPRRLAELWLKNAKNDVLFRNLISNMISSWNRVREVIEEFSEIWSDRNVISKTEISYANLDANGDSLDAALISEYEKAPILSHRSRSDTAFSSANANVMLPLCQGVVTGSPDRDYKKNYAPRFQNKLRVPNPQWVSASLPPDLQWTILQSRAPLDLCLSGVRLKSLESFRIWRVNSTHNQYKARRVRDKVDSGGFHICKFQLSVEVDVVVLGQRVARLFLRPDAGINYYRRSSFEKAVPVYMSCRPPHETEEGWEHAIAHEGNTYWRVGKTYPYPDLVRRNVDHFWNANTRLFTRWYNNQSSLMRIYWDRVNLVERKVLGHFESLHRMLDLSFGEPAGSVKRAALVSQFFSGQAPRREQWYSRVENFNVNELILKHFIQYAYGGLLNSKLNLAELVTDPERLPWRDELRRDLQARNLYMVAKLRSLRNSWFPMAGKGDSKIKVGKSDLTYRPRIFRDSSFQYAQDILQRLSERYNESKMKEQPQFIADSFASEGNLQELDWHDLGGEVTSTLTIFLNSLL